MSCAGGPDLIQDGLVLHLDAADRKSYPGSGIIWTDRSGLGNNGTLTNGPTFSAANGGNIVFDGVNDYVLPPDIGGTIEAISIAAWVRYTSLSIGANTIIGRSAEGFGSPQNFILYIGSDAKVYFQSSADNYRNVASTSTILVNNWFYITATYTGSATKNRIIYINGKKEATVTNNNNPPTNIYTSRTTIGQNSTDTPKYFFTGSIASILFYYRVLSDSEILQNYNSQKSRFNLI